MRSNVLCQPRSPTSATTKQHRKRPVAKTFEVPGCLYNIALILLRFSVGAVSSRAEAGCNVTLLAAEDSEGLREQAAATTPPFRRIKGYES
jgi:hypothetical protein